MKKHHSYILLSIFSCVGLVTVVVVFYYLLFEQAIKNYLHADKPINYSYEVDPGFGIPPESPISLEECTPNARKVVEKFKPGEIYQCSEEEVLFENTKIPYIQINPLVVQSHHQTLFAIMVKGEPQEVEIKPSFWTNYAYPDDPVEVFKQRYHCEIKDYEKAEDHGEVVYEIIPSKNSYTWKINYQDLMGISTRDIRNSCIIKGYAIINGYGKKSTFVIDVQIVKPKPL